MHNFKGARHLRKSYVNRLDLSVLVNTCSEISGSRSSGGSEFHTVGAATQKGLKPSLAVRVRGTTSWCCAVDLKRPLPGTKETGTQCCGKY